MVDLLLLINFLKLIFRLEISYPLFYQTSDFNEEVNCTGSIPCIINNSVSSRYIANETEEFRQCKQSSTKKSKYIITLMLIGLYNIKLKVGKHGSNAMIEHSNADPETTILNLLAAQQLGRFSQHFIFFISYEWV